MDNCGGSLLFYQGAMWVCEYTGLYFDSKLRIILYSVLGLLTFDTVKSVLMLTPFALSGLIADMKCSNYMDEKPIKNNIHTTGSIWSIIDSEKSIIKK